MVSGGTGAILTERATWWEWNEAAILANLPASRVVSPQDNSCLLLSFGECLADRSEVENNLESRESHSQAKSPKRTPTGAKSESRSGSCSFQILGIPFLIKIQIPVEIKEAFSRTLFKPDSTLTLIDDIFELGHRYQNTSSKGASHSPMSNYRTNKKQKAGRIQIPILVLGVCGLSLYTSW